LTHTVQTGLLTVAMVGRNIGLQSLEGTAINGGEWQFIE